MHSYNDSAASSSWERNQRRQGHRYRSATNPSPVLPHPAFMMPQPPPKPPTEGTPFLHRAYTAPPPIPPKPGAGPYSPPTIPPKLPLSLRPNPPPPNYPRKPTMEPPPVSPDDTEMKQALALSVKETSRQAQALQELTTQEEDDLEKALQASLRVTMSENSFTSAPEPGSPNVYSTPAGPSSAGIRRDSDPWAASRVAEKAPTNPWSSSKPPLSINSHTGPANPSLLNKFSPFAPLPTPGPAMPSPHTQLLNDEAFARQLAAEEEEDRKTPVSEWQPPTPTDDPDEVLARRIAAEEQAEVEQNRAEDGGPVLDTPHVENEAAALPPPTYEYAMAPSGSSSSGHSLGEQASLSRTGSTTSSTVSSSDSLSTSTQESSTASNSHTSPPTGYAPSPPALYDSPPAPYDLPPPGAYSPPSTSLPYDAPRTNNYQPPTSYDSPQVNRHSPPTPYVAPPSASPPIASAASPPPPPQAGPSTIDRIEEVHDDVVPINQYVDSSLLRGVSVGFSPPKISQQLLPMGGVMPNIISLPYGRCPPLHLQAPNWRHLLKLMAWLSGTRMEPTVEAMAVTKTDSLFLRTVIQFIKPHHASTEWRTVLWFTIDHPVPPQLPGARKYTNNDVDVLPFSYTLSNIPTFLKDGSDTPISKTYTIPATDSLPYPPLPISFPSLAMYLQASLVESRKYAHDSSSGLRKLAKMIDTCYPEATDADPSRMQDVRGLFSRVIGRGNRNKKNGRSGNEDTYELVTPFVPDQWG